MRQWKNSGCGNCPTPQVSYFFIFYMTGEARGPAALRTNRHHYQQYLQFLKLLDLHVGKVALLVSIEKDIQIYAESVIQIQT